jgi:squalene synthase HpnC
MTSSLGPATEVESCGGENVRFCVCGKGRRIVAFCWSNNFRTVVRSIVKKAVFMSKILTNTWTFAESDTGSLESARAYCRRLAKSHYENFIVASVLLPRRLKQHFYNIYAYCRISDDLGDEADNPKTALQLLEQWEVELKACYRGQTRHPVFIALADTIECFEIPIAPFADLLEAFKRDQTQTRYATWGELLDYCRYSANPVGHLVLYLGGYRDSERQRLSDLTCTALQLANHWQDLARDLFRLDRIYLPEEDMERFDYYERDLRAQVCDERFVGLMRVQVERARQMFLEGRRLCDCVDSSLSLDVELFSRCGLEVLQRIEAAQFDVFRKRPELGKWTHARILAQSWWNRYRSRHRR